MVRGEEQVEVEPGMCVDELRKLPWGFQEFGSNEMSELASKCRECGVEDLFLTCMKIYRDSNDGCEAEDDASKRTVKNKKAGTKKNVRQKR